MYTELHERAHARYCALKDHERSLWAILDRAAENWNADGRPGTLEDYYREYGCPEEKLLSKRTFLLSEYHNTGWAMYNLSDADLKLWAEEHNLDFKTLIAYRGDISWMDSTDSHT